MLHTGLLLAADLLHAHLPESIYTLVRQDAVAAKLVAQILRWLPGAGHTPPALFETRDVSPAYARWPASGTCLSSAQLFFLPRKKIGNKVLRSVGTASSMRCAVHIVSHVNTAVGTNSERVPLV